MSLRMCLCDCWHIWTLQLQLLCWILDSNVTIWLWHFWRVLLKGGQAKAWAGLLMVCPWWFVSSKTADFRSRSALKHGLGNNASLFSSTVYVRMYAYVPFVVVDNQLKVTYRHLDWIWSQQLESINSLLQCFGSSLWTHFWKVWFITDRFCGLLQRGLWGLEIWSWSCFHEQISGNG